MDEALVELFVRHDDSLMYNGNLMGEFWASIGDCEYSLDKMPETIGLNGGRLIIMFSPSEFCRRATNAGNNYIVNL